MLYVRARVMYLYCSLYLFVVCLLVFLSRSLTLALINSRAHVYVCERDLLCIDARTCLLVSPSPPSLNTHLVSAQLPTHVITEVLLLRSRW